MSPRLVAVLAVVLALPPGAQTPALPTVDQILSKQIEAVGGRAALERVTSLTAYGTLSVAEAGITGSIELYAKAPNRTASFVDINGLQQADAFDGSVGWSSDPQNGLRLKAGVELADTRNAAVFNKELNMKTTYPTMTVSGRERVGGRDAFAVDATPAEGRPVRMFFDAETGLLLRQVVTRDTPMGPLEVDVLLEDYRPVDGVKRPFTIRQITQVFTAVIQFTEIKQNVEIDDAVFRKPGF